MLRADIGVYDWRGQLIAVAEVKNMLGTSCDWAAKLRRNLFAHDGVCGAEYFLIITPDRLYLWKGVGTDLNQVPPTHEADMQPEFAKYFEGAGIEPDRIHRPAFEIMVDAWLSEAIRFRGEAKELAGNRSWLAESGLLSAVRDGRIEHEVPM